jgi:hypothetical protein
MAKLLLDKHLRRCRKVATQMLFRTGGQREDCDSRQMKVERRFA